MRVRSDDGTASFFRAPIIRPGFTADRAEVKIVMWCLVMTTNAIFVSSFRDQLTNKSLFQ